MSNEINTGKVPAHVVSNSGQKTDPLSPGKQGEQAARPGPSTSDKVSMTDDAARLQEIEGLLKNTPPINSELVAEVSQLLAAGKLEINLERIAASLLETEAGITKPE